MIGVHVSVTGVYNANQWSSQKAFKESKANNFWYYTRTIIYIKPIPIHPCPRSNSFISNMPVHYSYKHNTGYQQQQQPINQFSCCWGSSPRIALPSAPLRGFFGLPRISCQVAPNLRPVLASSPSSSSASASSSS